MNMKNNRYSFNATVQLNACFTAMVLFGFAIVSKITLAIFMSFLVLNDTAFYPMDYGGPIFSLGRKLMYSIIKEKSYVYIILGRENGERFCKFEIM